MSGLGTDLVAVACILGGAAVSGATTMAVVDGHGRQMADATCSGVALREGPRMVVSLDGGKGTIVVAPHVRIHTMGDCASVVVGVDRDVQVNMEEVRARLDEARARMEEARGRIEEARGRAEAAQDAAGSALSEEIQARVEKRIQERMKRLDKELAKLDAGTGR